MITVKSIPTPSIYTYPTEKENVPDGMWVTLGDLHGNAVKLLNFLCRMNMIEISEEDYKKFVKDYNENIITPLSLPHLKMLLSRITVKTTVNLRLIGDELADRGQNDFFTLWLLEHLINQGMNVEIIFSNHASVFIKHIEAAINQSKRMLFGINDDKFRTVFNKQQVRKKGEQFQSLQNLKETLKWGFISVSDLLSLYDTYKPRVKVFSYDRSPEGELLIYSHAPMSKDRMLDLARDLEIDNLPVSADKLDDDGLIWLIDAINARFQQYIKTGTAHQLLYESPESSNLKRWLHYVIWDHELDEDPEFNNIHGHYGNATNGRVSLDSPCGIAGYEHREMPYVVTSAFENKPEPEAGASSKRRLKR